MRTKLGESLLEEKQSDHLNNPDVSPFSSIRYHTTMISLYTSTTRKEYLVSIGSSELPGSVFRGHLRIVSNTTNRLLHGVLVLCVYTCKLLIIFSSSRLLLLVNCNQERL